MRLRVLLVAFLQAAFSVQLLGSLGDVSGYLGDNVTLPSGADPSWKLNTISWSVWSNNTLIATFRLGRTNTQQVDRYKGRLSLNTSSGDLTIHKVTTEDAMEYTVDLISDEQDSTNSITLKVRQRLQKPTAVVQTGACTAIKGSCWIKLHCSTTDKAVNVSWQVKPPSVTVFDKRNPDGNAAVLLAFLNTTQDNVEFTCTSSRHLETSSSVITPTCADDNPQPQTWRGRAVFLFVGVIVGILVTAIIIYFCGEQIKATWQNLKENCPPKTKSESEGEGTT